MGKDKKVAPMNVKTPYSEKRLMKLGSRKGTPMPLSDAPLSSVKETQSAPTTPISPGEGTTKAKASPSSPFKAMRKPVEFDVGSKPRLIFTYGDINSVSVTADSVTADADSVTAVICITGAYASQVEAKEYFKGTKPIGGIFPNMKGTNDYFFFFMYYFNISLVNFITAENIAAAARRGHCEELSLSWMGKNEKAWMFNAFSSTPAIFNENLKKLQYMNEVFIPQLEELFDIKFNSIDLKTEDVKILVSLNSTC